MNSQVTTFDMPLNTQRKAEIRYHCPSNLTSLSWHYDGKQFITGHQDGSICVWSRGNEKPQSKYYPHAPEQPNTTTTTTTTATTITAGHPGTRLSSITNLSWSKSGSDSLIIFSGGLTTERTAVTVMRGKAVAILELDYVIISILPMLKSPWECDVPSPGEIFVLLGSLVI